MEVQKRLGAFATAISASLASFVLFAYLLKPDLGAILSMVATVPWPTFVIVAALEALNLMAGAQKWRISIRYFCSCAPPSLVESLEATAVGSLLGQMVPPQIGTAGARAMLVARSGGRRMAVWTTLHEQSFDLAALCAAGSISWLAFVMQLSPTTAVVLCLVAGLGGLVFVQLIFRLAALAATTLRSCGQGRLSDISVSVACVLSEAASAPWHVPSALLALSLLRIGLIAGRALVVVVVLLPTASLYPIALGFPAVQLLSSLPLSAAGLGLAEWSWAGVLDHAGTPLQQAADAAIALRLVSLIAFGLILVLLALRRVTRLAFCSWMHRSLRSRA